MENMMDSMLVHMNEDEHKILDNLLTDFISEDLMKAFLNVCLRIDIADNNDKAEIIKHIIGPEFVELGTGTNRIAFRYKGFVVKIALDRRG